MAYIPSVEEVMQANGNTDILNTTTHYSINYDLYFDEDDHAKPLSDASQPLDSSQPSRQSLFINSPLDSLVKASFSFFTYSNYSPHKLTEVDISNFSQEFEQYASIYSPLFFRSEQRRHGETYLRGLLSDINNKSVEGIVIPLIGPDERAIRNMQHFISQGTWDDEAILKQHWQEVNKDLGHEDAVLTLDGSDFPKQGDQSVAVQRQHCGQLGKVANCQAGVFVGYVSPSGYTLLDRRLYLPEKWLSDEYAEKREKCAVPADVIFKTKPELGLEMLTGIYAQKTLPAQWLTCDEAFGRSGAFLDGVAALDLWYFAEVPHDTRVWQEQPQVELPPYKGRGRRPTKKQVVEGSKAALTVHELAESIPDSDWSREVIKEGSKGPIVADFAFQRVFGVRDGLPGDEVWLVLRRSEGEIKTRTQMLLRLFRAND